LVRRNNVEDRNERRKIQSVETTRFFSRRRVLQHMGTAAAVVGLPGCASLASSREHFVLVLVLVLVLVHGAWHGPWCWNKLTPVLPR
jgi:hypothetical protein